MALARRFETGSWNDSGGRGEPSVTPAPSRGPFGGALHGEAVVRVGCGRGVARSMRGRRGKAALAAVDGGLVVRRVDGGGAWGKCPPTCCQRNPGDSDRWRGVRKGKWPCECAFAWVFAGNTVSSVRARTSGARPPSRSSGRRRTASRRNRRAALRSPRPGAPRSPVGGRARGARRSPRSAVGTLSGIVGRIVRTLPPRPSFGPPRPTALAGLGARIEPEPSAPCPRIGRSGGLESRSALVHGLGFRSSGDVARASPGRTHCLCDPRPRNPGGASE